MQPLPPAEQTCENCVHSRSKGPKHCSCYPGEPPFPFQEDPWHLEQRADAIIGKLRGRLAATREVLTAQNHGEPSREDHTGTGPNSYGNLVKTGVYRYCPICQATTKGTKYTEDWGQFGLPKHKPTCSWRILQEALSSDFGKPEADVIAAVPEALQEAKHIIQRLYENMWGGKPGDWKTYAPKLEAALKAVKRMHNIRNNG